MITTRFAPSPTGYLHVGNLRTALFNYLIARKRGGTFVLRLDDTDPERSRDEFAEAIREDLAWLGLDWDRETRQSDRIHLYEDAANRLRESGRLYECFETADELAFKRRLQQKLGKPPVYDRSALSLSDQEKEKLKLERPGYWRFRLDHERVSWDDVICGGVSIDSASLSDPVLVRGDGQFLYTLSSVVDDLDMGITDVVRGSDHVTNTATQIQVIRSLDGLVPQFAHHSLITGPGGEPLSKRQRNVSIRDLRERGVEPMALLSHFAFVGSSKTFRLCATLEELGEAFDLDSFGSAPTKYDPADLDRLSARHLASLPFAAVKERVKQLGVSEDIAEPFWEATRENIMHFGDLEYWWSVVANGAVPLIEDSDRAFVKEALSLLPNPPYTDQTWSTWTKQVGERTGRKGRSLFLPLRKALTGKAKGPEMAALMPLLRLVARQ